MSHLNEKRTALADVQGKLQSLNDNYEMKVIKKKVSTVIIQCFEKATRLSTNQVKDQSSIIKSESPHTCRVKRDCVIPLIHEVRSTILFKVIPHSKQK